MTRDTKIVESILLLADEPVPARLIGEVLERPRAEVEDLLEGLARDYRQQDRGFVLRQTAAGWRLYTDPACAPWLERFVARDTRGRLTGAALEVLAIVAYRGPISRAGIAEVRGVDSDRVVRTLSLRGLIAEAPGPKGGATPARFVVTDGFLEKVGLRSVDELPPLAGFMPDTEAVEEMEARLHPNA